MRKLRGRFNAFGSDAQPQGVAHSYDRRNECPIGLIGRAIPYKGSVDLQRMQRILLHQAEARISGSEVVYRDLNAETTEGLQMAQNPSGDA